MQYESEPELRFDGSNDAAIHWAARSGLEEHLSLDAVEEMYERALPYLAAWAYASLPSTVGKPRRSTPLVIFPSHSGESGQRGTRPIPTLTAHRMGLQPRPRRSVHC
jgi:hypothetical protein